MQIKHQKITHLFHIVDTSPWPFLLSLVSAFFTVSVVMYLHNFGIKFFILFQIIISLLLIILIMSLWWYDIIIEGTFQGMHTIVVQKGLKIGIILFIVSEVMFFFSFFWAFFHSSLVPVIQIGSIWPPKNINTFFTFSTPLLNTFILLNSGIYITAAHHFLLNKTYSAVSFNLFYTLLLAILFTILQIKEYKFALFDISDGIYGSVFFMATGFHGFHVIIGSIFILISLIRNIYRQFNEMHHIGFIASVWYWHFVDVVWLFLFLSIYWWGNK